MPSLGDFEKMRLRSRSVGSHDALYERAESALNDLVAKEARGELSPEDAENVYRETLGVLRRTRAILEGVGDGVFVTDDEGKIRLWNRAAERLIGTPEKKVVGRDCSRMLNFCFRDRFSTKVTPLDCSRGCALIEYLKGRPPGTSVEVTRPRPGGHDQQLLVSASVVEGEEGEVSEVVHSMRDITRLKEADEAKTMFLATASHELKTPLTVILGFTQTLISGWLDEAEQGQALKSIETRAKQLSHIVDRLLLTGRIESGRVRLQIVPSYIVAMLKERVEALTAATGRTIVCDVPDDLPPVVADVEALTTAIDHLLDNAVKYSPDGGEIIVTAKAQGSKVLIEVDDPGIGMTPDELTECFDKFWQAEQSDVRRFGGTGVGLYIVKSMTEGMGGSVSVASTVGSGSRFSITLRKAEEGSVRASKEELGTGPRSMIQEFMRQLGVPQEGGGAGT
jgi:signal transduction histidine kinase